MELSNDEQVLLVAAIGYIAAVAIWALSMHARAKSMLRQLSGLVDPAVWNAIGAPDTLKAAMKDPERRWYRFVRSGEYLKQCDDAAVELIDDFRRRSKLMLIVCAGGGLLLLIRFWPLLKPDFL
jgi:hypothetical protein